MQRAMRQRQLKGLVKRLKQLQQMKFNDTPVPAQAGRGQGALPGRLAGECLNEPAVASPQPSSWQAG
jgi:hypothetical protein